MDQLLNFDNALENGKYGVWIDGIFSWLESGNWICDSSYLMEKRNFINENLNLSITLQPKDLETGVLQEVRITNLKTEKRNIKFFFSQTFTEKDSNSLTFYAPTISAIIHACNDDYLLVNGMLNKRGIVQYCTDFRDPCLLQEGIMLMQPFSSKRSESIFSLEGEIQAKENVNAYLWFCKGMDVNDLQQNNTSIKSQLLNALDSETNYSKTF